MQSYELSTLTGIARDAVSAINKIGDAMRETNIIRRDELALEKLKYEAATGHRLA